MNSDNPDKATPATLHERAAYLVSITHRGSVNAAANAWGVPQRTLARIVKGSTRNPNMRAVWCIAMGNGLPVEWLVSGTGPSPLEVWGARHT